MQTVTPVRHEWWFIQPRPTVTVERRCHWLHLSSNGIYSSWHCTYSTSSKHVTPWYSPLWLTLAKSSTPVSFLWNLFKLKLWFIWVQYCTGNTFLMTEVLSLIIKTFCNQTVFLQWQISFTSGQILLVNRFLKPSGFTVRHYHRQQTHKTQTQNEETVRSSYNLSSLKSPPIPAPHALSFLPGRGHTFDCQ